MRASIEAKKDKVLQELAEARSSILEIARALPPEKQGAVFLGEWSPRDLIAHLIGWDHANIEAAQALLQGQLPGFYAHKDRDWRTFNAGLVAQYRRDDLAQLLADAQVSQRQLLDLLSSIPAEEIVRDRGIRYAGWRVTIERLMLAEASDERKHAEQLKTL